MPFRLLRYMVELINDIFQKAKGFSVDEIAEATELSVDEIIQL